MEGSLEKFTDTLEFPLSNLKSDNTYIREGTYARKLLALNLVFNAMDATRFYLTFLKSIDDTNSIKFGGPDAQNFVLGSGTTLNIRNNILKSDFGVALSVTTFDIRRGVCSKAQINEMFGADLPFEPENLKWLIMLNGTTVPLSWENKPPLAFYANVNINLLKQNFLFRYQRIGSAYYSFGNPYLVNDRSEISAEDRFNMFKIIMALWPVGHQTKTNIRLTCNTTVFPSARPVSAIHLAGTRSVSN